MNNNKVENEHDQNEYKTEERNCSICKNYVLNDSGEYYSCRKWSCQFEEEE